MGKKVRSYALPIIGGIVGSAIPGVGTALGASLGSGLGSYAADRNVSKALLSAGGSYLGGNIASNVLGNAGGTVIGGLESVLGPDLGSAIGQGLGSAALTPLSSIAGSQIGSNLASSLVPQKTANPVGQTPSAAAAAFKPTREVERSAPPSITGYGALNPQQMSSNLATQGVYGGGLGKEESDYFTNMINRRLITDEGAVDSDLSEINPIENSFLSQLGLTGKTPSDLLQAISRYRQQAA